MQRDNPLAVYGKRQCSVSPVRMSPTRVQVFELVQKESASASYPGYGT
jgi:hypothetical protein